MNYKTAFENKTILLSKNKALINSVVKEMGCNILYELVVAVVVILCALHNMVPC